MKIDEFKDTNAVNKLACDLLSHNQDEPELYKAISNLQSALPKVREAVGKKLEMHAADDEAKCSMLKALAQLESNENLNEKACEHLLAAMQIKEDADICYRLALIYSKLRLFEKASQYFMRCC